MGKLVIEKQNNNDGIPIAKKVAILLIQLGEEASANLFSYMDFKVVSEVSKYMAEARSIDKALAHQILKEFYELIKSDRYIRSGGVEYTKDVLYKAYGNENAKEILDKLLQNLEENESFSYLEKIKPEQLADFIAKEHPQTIALVLVHLSPALAAQTLSCFSEQLRSNVALRMANLEEISPEIVQNISKVLESKLGFLSVKKVEAGGARVVADILNELNPKESRKTIDYIEQSNDTLAANIKEMMFGFEDIAFLSDYAIKEMLKAIDKKTLMLSLKGASEEVFEKIMSNMSQRVSDSFKEEMKFLGAVRLKDVKEAQKIIIEEVALLVEQDVIQMGEEEMVE